MANKRIYIYKITKGEEEMEDKTLLRPEDIEKICRCSRSMAYKIIQKLNAELKEQGFLCFRGRTNRDYLYERLGIKDESK